MNAPPRSAVRKSFGLQSLLWMSFAVACFFAGRFSYKKNLPSEPTGTVIELPVGKSFTFAASSTFSKFLIASTAHVPVHASPSSRKHLEVVGKEEGEAVLLLWDQQDRTDLIRVEVVEPTRAAIEPKPTAELQGTGRGKTAGKGARMDNIAGERAGPRVPVLSAPRNEYAIYDLAAYVNPGASEDKGLLAAVFAELKDSVLQYRRPNDGEPVSAQLISDTEFIVSGDQAAFRMVEAYLYGFRDGNRRSEE